MYRDDLGTQEKYRQGGFWYKVDTLGKEGVAEHLASLVLACSDLDSSVPFVDYQTCNINGRSGCKSADFLSDGEEFVSFRCLYKNTCGGNLSEKVASLEECAQVGFVLDFVKECTGVDVSAYVKTCVTLDFLTMNPDRHFGNLGVIRKRDGLYRLAPVFDNGQGLGQNYQITPPTCTFLEKEQRLCAAPFSGSFVKSLEFVGGPYFKIDYEKLFVFLKNEPRSFAADFLKERLVCLEKMLNNNNEKVLYEKS